MIITCIGPDHGEPGEPSALFRLTPDDARSVVMLARRLNRGKDGILVMIHRKADGPDPTEFADWIRLSFAGLAEVLILARTLETART